MTRALGLAAVACPQLRNSGGRSTLAPPLPAAFAGGLHCPVRSWLGSTATSKLQGPTITLDRVHLQEFIEKDSDVDLPREMMMFVVNRMILRLRPPFRLIGIRLFMALPKPWLICAFPSAFFFTGEDGDGLDRDYPCAGNAKCS